MTLGADFAPPGRRGEFLGLWRLITDFGGAIGPATISVFTTIASLGLASVVSGGVGLAGAAVLLAFVPETLRRRTQQPAVIPVPPPGPSP
jgi:MFS-type transporter involved in bile tolerance (Atg22 family)